MCLKFIESKSLFVGQQVMYRSVQLLRSLDASVNMYK